MKYFRKTVFFAVLALCVALAIIFLAPTSETTSSPQAVDGTPSKLPPAVAPAAPAPPAASAASSINPAASGSSTPPPQTSIAQLTPPPSSSFRVIGANTATPASTPRPSAPVVRPATPAAPGKPGAPTVIGGLAEAVSALPAGAVYLEKTIPSDDPSILLRDQIVRVEGRRYPAVRRVIEQSLTTPDAEPIIVQEMVADQILVNLAPGVTVEALAAATGVPFTLRRILPGTGTAVLAFEVTEPATVEAVQQTVEDQTALINFSEPDHIVRILNTPNDSRYTDGSLWGMHNIGQNSGTSDADVDAPEGWDTRTSAISSALTQSRASRSAFGFGPNELVIAVVDTGVRYTHEDLAANMWVNPSEIPGNGIDDDANNVIDDVYGVNAVANNGDPMDDHYHGTHCAGTIAGVGNNSLGVSGIAWQAKIVACKFLDADGSGANSDASEALWYAWEQAGADVISNSWGGGVESQEITNQLRAAAANGAVIVVAAGNDSTDLETNQTFPAASQVAGMITVSSSTRIDAVSSFSNTSFGWSNIFAPGTDIISCGNDNDSDYETLSGTSMATPMVAGAAALLRAQFPTETAAQIINRIYRGVDAKSAFTGKCQTGGRLNLAASLATTSSTPANDAFSSATTIPSSVPRALRTANFAATAEASEPAHGGTAANKTIWYSWTAPATANYIFSTRGSHRQTVTVGTGGAEDTYRIENLDTVLGIYTGSAVNALTPVVANDDFTDTSGTTSIWSRVTLAATSGTTYRIALGSKASANDQGLIILSISEPPANDALASATVVSSLPYSVTRSNLNAGRESGEPKLTRADVTDTNTLPADTPQHIRDTLADTYPEKRGQVDDGGASIWWSWTPSTTAEYTVSTEGGSIDDLLGIYTGSAVNALTLVAQNDDIGLVRIGNEWVYMTAARIRRTFNAGTTYYIKIDGFGGKEGSVNLNIAQPPANDHIANATLMTGNVWSALVNNVGASLEQGEPKHNDEYGAVSVWYKWVAPSTQDYQMSMGVTTINVSYAVYTAANPAAPDVNQLTAIAGATGITGTGFRFAANAGQTYFFVVDGVNGRQASGMLLDLSSPPGAMLNDMFAERVRLFGTSASVTSDTGSASFETGEPDKFGAPSQRSVWWTWTAPASGNVTFTTQFSTYNAPLGAYTGSTLGSLTEIAYQQPATGQGVSAFGTITFTATRGVTYHLCVFGDASYCGPLTLNLGMTVTNQLPTVTGSTLSATSLFSDQSLTVTSVTTSDAESNPVTLAYQWQKSPDNQNWSNAAGLTSVTLPAADTNAGAYWRCAITPSDATGDGSIHYTASAQIQRRPVQTARHGQAFTFTVDLPIQGALPPIKRKAIINEFAKGAGTTTQTGTLNGEWYELLVLQDQNMVGYFFGNVFRNIRFKDHPLWQNVPKGTMILIYNPTSKQALVPADDVSTTDGNGLIVVSGSNATYFDNGNGFPPSCPKLSGSADVFSDALGTGARIFLHRAHTGGIDDISYEDTSILGALAQFKKTPHLPAWLGGGQAYRYTRDTEDFCESSANWELGAADASFATPGQANNIAQVEWLTKLRAPAPRYRFAASSQTPSGLTLNETTGEISGTINEPAGGLFRVVVERFATSSVTVSQTFDILVAKADRTYTIGCGQTFSQQGNLDLGTATLVNRGTINANGFSLTQKQSYATWAAAYAVTGSQTDLLPNLGVSRKMAFALNLDPATASTADLPWHDIENISGSDYLTLTFRRQKGTPRVTYTLQASGNLTAWTDLDVATHMVGSPVAIDHATEQVTARDAVALGGSNTRRFLRLKVTDNLVPPPAPASPSATLGTGQAGLSWSASTGAETYTVKRSTTPGGPYTVVASGITGLSYNDTSVATGTTYYYVITATNTADGESASSTEVTVTTPASWAPAAPTGLAASSNAMQVGLTWNAVSGATTYTVRRSTTSGSGYTNLATGLTGTSYDDTTALIGTTYFYVVTATNAGGTSTESSQVSGAVVQPLGWWRMNETSGLTATNSGSAGSAQNATLQNTSGVTWSAGKFANAATLDGVGTSNTVSSYFRAASGNLTASTTNTCTITLWVKGNLSAAGWRGLFYDRSGSVQKGIHTNNGVLRIGNWENDNQTASSLTIPNNTWTFVALTVSPTQMRAWLRTENASSFSTWTSSATSFTARQWQRPGIGGDLWNANLAGQIDDVRFYDRTLTEAELAAIYANSNQ